MVHTRTLFLAFALALAVPQTATAIPAFARRYRMSCQTCHNPVPTLNAFGEVFVSNGYRIVTQEDPSDTINTGDDQLWLLKDVPLAIRLDAYVTAYTNGQAVTDFQTPYNLKVLSGAALSRTFSYYFYFFLYERGEVGGVEDAFILANDIGGSHIDVAAGQFQVTDPLFKRELRLEVQDYVMYRARIGDQPADLTYDRGLMTTVEFAGFTATGMVVNGNGKGPTGANRHFDDNRLKNFAGHLTRDLTQRLRLGAFGYRGQQEGTAAGGGPTVTSTVTMVGVDGTAEVGPFQLNAQYLHREDNKPTFTIGEPTAQTDGGFAELLFRPAGSRWYGLALYNRITCTEPLLDARLGGSPGLRRYETLTGGAGYLLRRNLRMYGEVTGDFETESATWTIGLTTAF